MLLVLLDLKFELFLLGFSLSRFFFFKQLSFFFLFSKLVRDCFSFCLLHKLSCYSYCVSLSKRYLILVEGHLKLERVHGCSTLNLSLVPLSSLLKCAIMYKVHYKDVSFTTMDNWANIHSSLLLLFAISSRLSLLIVTAIS